MRSMLLKAVAFAVSTVPLLALADPPAFDVSGITSAGESVALVGAAVFLVMVGIKVYKWVRRAL
jgi:hypothetical protein